MWKEALPVNVVHTDAYSHLVPADVHPMMGARAETSFVSRQDRSLLQEPSAVNATRFASGKVPSQIDAAQPEKGVSAEQLTQLCATQAKMGKDSINIQMEIKFPKKEKKQKVVEKQSQGSLLSGIFTEQKFPEPVYFQSVDCVGLPELLTPKECRLVIDFAEAQGFSVQHRHRVLNMMWSDIVDPYFAEALWQLCGLGWFLRTITIDGMVPCGLNDVIRVQKYVQGSLFGRHTDQELRRSDGKCSKYSLRIFLNSKEDDEFDGGLSVFHPPFRQNPVILEPEMGLGLLYPQGELCTVQEETEVVFGYKYVLRADVLFCRPEDLQRPGEFR